MDQKLSPSFTTQLFGLSGELGAGVAVGGAGPGGGTVVVVGGAVVAVVVGALVVVGGAVVVVDGGAVVVVVVVVVDVEVSDTGGPAEAGGPGLGPMTGTVEVVANKGASVEDEPDAGAEPDAPASRSATDDPPPHAVTVVASAPMQIKRPQRRFTGGERSRGARYLAKSSRNSRSPLLPTLAGPPEGLLML